MARKYIIEPKAVSNLYSIEPNPKFQTARKPLKGPGKVGKSYFEERKDSPSFSVCIKMIAKKIMTT